MTGERIQKILLLFGAGFFISTVRELYYFVLLVGFYLDFHRVEAFAVDSVGGRLSNECLAVDCLDDAEDVDRLYLAAPHKQKLNLLFSNTTPRRRGVSLRDGPPD